MVAGKLIPTLVRSLYLIPIFAWRSRCINGSMLGGAEDTAKPPAPPILREKLTLSDKQLHCHIQQILNMNRPMHISSHRFISLSDNSYISLHSSWCSDIWWITVWRLPGQSWNRLVVIYLPINNTMAEIHPAERLYKFILFILSCLLSPLNAVLASISHVMIGLSVLLYSSS